MSDIFSIPDAFSSSSSKQSDIMMELKTQKVQATLPHGVHNSGSSSVTTVIWCCFDILQKLSANVTQILIKTKNIEPISNRKYKQTSRASDFFSPNRENSTFTLTLCLAFVLSVIDYKTTSAPVVACTEGTWFHSKNFASTLTALKKVQLPTWFSGS